MLRDMMDYTRAPYSWHLAPMGYVRELRMIQSRGRELAPAWESHVGNTRRVIEESANASPRRGTVLVAGSGNLLDVPLAVLSRAFEEVVLLDIHHPAESRRAAARFANVKFISADVTGVAEDVFRAARRNQAESPPKCSPPVLRPEKFDLVVSVNLLSQLAVIPCNFLKGHCPAVSADALDTLTKDMVDSHLKWLSQTAVQACLVTDVERVETLTNGSVISKDIVGGADMPEPDERWDWNIAPLGGIFKDRSVIHRVRAYKDFRPGRG